MIYARISGCRSPPSQPFTGSLFLKQPRRKMVAPSGVIEISSTKFRETTQAHKGVNAYEKYSNPGFTPGVYKVSISEKGMGNPETVKRRDTLARQTNEALTILDEIKLGRLMTQINTEAEGLEMDGFKNVQAVNQKLMAFNDMSKSFIQLDVSNHDLAVEQVKAPLLKANASFSAETLHEQLLTTVGGMIKARTDRATLQWTLQQHGYDVSALPAVPENLSFPIKMDFNIPEFVRPELTSARNVQPQPNQGQQQ
jgi:hypothetical protein